MNDDNCFDLPLSKAKGGGGRRRSRKGSRRRPFDETNTLGRVVLIVS